MLRTLRSICGSSPARFSNVRGRWSEPAGKLTKIGATLRSCPPGATCEARAGIASCEPFNAPSARSYRTAPFESVRESVQPEPHICSQSRSNSTATLATTASFGSATISPASDAREPPSRIRSSRCRDPVAFAIRFPLEPSVSCAKNGTPLRDTVTVEKHVRPVTASANLRAIMRSFAVAVLSVSALQRARVPFA